MFWLSGAVVFSDYFSAILGLVRDGNSWSLTPFDVGVFPSIRKRIWRLSRKYARKIIRSSSGEKETHAVLKYVGVLESSTLDSITQIVQLPLPLALHHKSGRWAMDAERLHEPFWTEALWSSHSWWFQSGGDAGSEDTIRQFEMDLREVSGTDLWTISSTY